MNPFSKNRSSNHNSLENRLKESILQLSTPDSTAGARGGRRGGEARRVVSLESRRGARGRRGRQGGNSIDFLAVMHPKNQFFIEIQVQGVPQLVPQL